MILSVQAVTELGEGVLEQKILEQSAQMERYSHMVESIKGNNAEVFREVYFVLNSHKKMPQLRTYVRSVSLFIKILVCWVEKF